MHGTGKADVQQLLWKKNAFNFSAVFFGATALSPSGGHRAYSRTSLEHSLMSDDAEFAKKNQHEKGALPELLVEYILPVLSPTPAQAGLLQQDAHSPINQTQIYRSKAGDSCQK